MKSKITYYDIDRNGRLKFSAFLRMVHIAADDNATELGVGYTQLAPLSMSFVLQRFSAAAVQLPAYGEEIEIYTWPSAIERGAFIRKGMMQNKKGRKLLEWVSLWLLFDLQNRKILRPSALPVSLTGEDDRTVHIKPEKIEIPTDWENWGAAYHTYSHPVRYADVDTNAHMNNAVYGDLAGNAAFTPDIATGAWEAFHINYLAEARLGDTLAITARRQENTCLLIGDNGNTRSFTAQVIYTGL
jgi:acyl-ACP thioesterase